MKYRVINLSGDTYQVVYADDATVLFQGSLADCEAYIRLTEAGYM